MRHLRCLAAPRCALRRRPSSSHLHRRPAVVRTCKQRRGPPHGFAGQIAPRCLLNHLGEDGALGSLLVAALLVYLAASSIASVRMARLARCTLLAMQDSTACCSNDKRHRVRHCCPWKTPPCLPSWARRRRFFVRLERGRRWEGGAMSSTGGAKPVRSRAARATAEVSENKSKTSPRRVHVGEKTP